MARWRGAGARRTGHVGGNADRGALARSGGTDGGQSLLARPAALILVEDSQRQQARRQDRGRQEYGLTAAETRLAFELLQGGGRTEIAARLGISASTARAHLSQIFDKTGVRRQSELMALLLRS